MYKKFYFFVLTLFFSFLSVNLKAQDLPSYSLYTQNFYLLNPAAIGIESCKELIITGRQQWTGLENAPNTQTIGAYGQFNMFGKKSKNTANGLGLNFYNDRNGANTQRRFQLAFSQHLKLFETNRRKSAYISFALAGSGFQYQLREAGLTPENINDPILTGGTESATLINFDAAMMIYSKNFSMGLTAAQLIPSRISFYDTPYNVKPHFFSFVSFRKINKVGFGFEPLVVFKTTGTTHQLDLNSRIHLNTMIFTGVSYRHNLDNLPGESLMAGIQFGFNQKKYSIQYSYDFATSRIGSYNFGSHNIGISGKICSKKEPICRAYGSF